MYVPAGLLTPQNDHLVGVHAAAASPMVAAAALRGWTLLLTTLPSNAVGEVWREAQLNGLSTQLGRADVDVRAAAGSAAALLLDDWGFAEPEADSETDTGGHVPMHWTSDMIAPWLFAGTC